MSLASFAGTSRFEVMRLLGAGGMGEVYEVRDREQDARLALKVLRRRDARFLYRFKREFRVVQELSHPNLAALGELHEEDGTWFFTMELVDGVDFLAHVCGRRHVNIEDYTATLDIPRGSGRGRGISTRPRPDIALLRAALRQLFEALAFLHAAGKVHRDVKPSNVLVSPSGRVVLLDFGLVTESDAIRQSSDDIVGTPAYMAPEQAANKGLDASADCYAAGVILHEALTGFLPFEGGPTDILIAKQGAEAPDPRHTAPAPDDLARLCMRLLDPDPTRRPTAAEVVDFLGGGGEVRGQTQTRTGIFVGREAELATLHHALQDALVARTPRVVHLEGESGVGKSALLAELTAQLAAQSELVLVLAGRCYEREMMHYRAFDGVVDAIVRHLWTLDERECTWLTPGDAPLLCRMFAMFDGVRSFRGPLPPPGDIDSRTRAYGALRELLARMAKRWTLVITIDDLQWADADSLRLLAELLRAPGAPAALFVVASRPLGEGRDSAWLAQTLQAPVTRLPLAPLDAPLAHELASALLGPETFGDTAEAIAREAAGHPLHIAELVRHAHEGGGATRPLRLDDAIADRLGRFSPAARDLAELLALAGEPLRHATLRRAADLSSLEFQRAIAALRRGPQARRSGVSDDERIEPYHDRVREAVVARLDADQRRVLHDRLANAMLAAAEPPEALVRHLEGAGADERAARAAIEAAQRASASMAYDRAAELYATALRLGRFDVDETRALRIRLGEALIDAGRGRDAAAVFTEAAEGADPETRLACHRQAAEQLLICGYIDEGLAAISSLLAEVATPLPATPRRALWSLITNRVALALRGHRWKLRRESQVAPSTLVRLDVYKAVSHGLSMVDNIRGADFNARYLRLALRTGEPVRLCRALGTEAIFLGSQGVKSLGRARARLADVERLATELDSPFARAWHAGVLGTYEYFSGRFAAAAEALRIAEQRFLALRVREGYELNNLRMFRCFALIVAGDVGQLRPIFERWLAEAQLRGDLYAETVLRRRGMLLWIAEGDVAGGLAALERATWTPPVGRYHLQHWYELLARGELALCGAPLPDILDDVDRGIEQLRESLLSRVQMVRVQARWLQARLRLALARGPSERTAAIACARAAAKALRRERWGLATVLGGLIAACACAHAGDNAGAAARLRAVIAGAPDDLRMYAAVARHRLAPLVGGAEAVALDAEAAAIASSLGIASLPTIARLVAPWPTRGALPESSGV